MQNNAWILSLLGQEFILSPFMLINGLALITGLQILDYYLRQDMPDKGKRAYILFVISILFGWFGAHLLDWMVRDIPFQKAGFTFYGGLLSGGFFYFTIARFLMARDELLLSLHSAVIPLVVAHAIGRTGCFFGGCCFGSEIIENSFLHDFFHRHPAQLYEAAILFMFATLLLWLRKKGTCHLALVYLPAYSVCRFFLEFLRGDDRGVYLALSTSQWISILLFSLFTMIVFKKSFFLPFSRVVPQKRMEFINISQKNLPYPS